MGTRSTIKGYWRQLGNSGHTSAVVPTPAVVPAIVTVSFDVALANTTATGVYLPKGAVISTISLDGGGTGGVTPAVDIGVATAAADVDGLVNGADPTAAALISSGDTTAGVLFAAATKLSEDAQITAGDDGTGTNATGTVVATITYYMDDDGKLND